MSRVLVPAALLCLCGALCAAEPLTTGPPRMTNAHLPGSEASGVAKEAQVGEGTSEEEGRHYHPVEVQKPYVLEQHDKRFADGQYEYRYVLSNGVARHERSYWQAAGKGKVLARKGFYSHPLPNGHFLTVFYTADGRGYHENSVTYSKTVPVLPQELDVPTTPPTGKSVEPPKAVAAEWKSPSRDSGVGDQSRTTTGAPLGQRATTPPHPGGGL